MPTAGPELLLQPGGVGGDDVDVELQQFDLTGEASHLVVGAQAGELLLGPPGERLVER
jgi:hypothetical protein